MALLASMTAMAQENAKVDVHARYTKVVTPVDGKYESKRPPVEDRLFTSTAVEKKIKEVQKLLKKNPKLAWMFANCYPNTLESTVHYRVLENGDDDTFVYTGDIPAMWLRDSGAQVWPYVALANKDEKLKKKSRRLSALTPRLFSAKPSATRAAQYSTSRSATTSAVEVLDVLMIEVSTFL